MYGSTLIVVKDTGNTSSRKTRQIQANGQRKTVQITHKRESKEHGHLTNVRVVDLWLGED
jgi:hypothetical protein